MLGIPGAVQLFFNRKTGVEWFADLTMAPESLVDPAARPQQVFVLTSEARLLIGISCSMQVMSLPSVDSHRCFLCYND